MAVPGQAKGHLTRRPGSKSSQMLISVEECKYMLCYSLRALPGSKHFQLWASGVSLDALTTGCSMSLVLKGFSGAFQLGSKDHFKRGFFNLSLYLSC